MSSAREVLDYRDFESELIDAVNMSEIACDMVEQMQSATSRVTGGYRVTDDQMKLVSFSVYHANKLAIELKERWNQIHDSNVASKVTRKGGAK